MAFSSQQLQPDELSVVLSVLVGLPLEELMDKQHQVVEQWQNMVGEDQYVLKPLLSQLKSKQKLHK